MILKIFLNGTKLNVKNIENHVIVRIFRKKNSKYITTQD